MKPRRPNGAPADPDERYRLVYDIAYRVAYRMCRNRSTAEDLAQDTWISVDSFLERYRDADGEEIRDFRRWVHRVATNKTINQYKSKWQRVLRKTQEADETLRAKDRRPDELFELKELGARVRDAMEELSGKQSKAFTLYYSGHSYEEIATRLDCPVGTIKGRIHRARTRLAGILQSSPQVRTAE